MQINHHFSRFEREHVLRDMKERLARMTDHAREEKRVLRASDDPVDFERIARIDRQQQTIAHRTKVIASLEADLKQASVSLKNARDRLSAFRNEVSLKADALQAGEAQASADKIRELMSGLVGAINTRRADGSYLFASSGAPISDTAGPGAAAVNFALSAAAQAPAAVEIGDGLHHTHASQVWQGMPDLLNRLGAAAASLTNAGNAGQGTVSSAVLRGLAEPVGNQASQVSAAEFVNDHSVKRLEAVRKDHVLQGEVLVKARVAIEGKSANEALPALLAMYRAISAARTAHAEVGKLSFFDAI
ncbi:MULTISPECIES: flagellar hook-associated protein 3 [Pandoraea]|uniref:Flagellar hook-associated protein 3 n=1 Tax=Pandoraea communis TaxID=2508297 RepID=A0A5E4YY22_9BURK|nr:MULTISPECIES: flagellar hook-associated protein 3 [Pandoraea]EON15106.1 flagellar hook-associated protein 3 [Pandoraea sp. SD6-2]VVE53348.1 flagellar hook-associated protein 3 [Pandoraea communis]